MRVGSRSIFGRGVLRFAFFAVFLVMAMVVAPIGAGAVGNVVIGIPDNDSGGDATGLAIGDMVSVASDALNVRSGPGTGYSVIDVMVFGQNGIIVDGPVYIDGYTWFELNYVGGTVDGWVAGEYLVWEGGPGLGVGDMVFVTSDALNVRSGPGTGYSVIDVMVFGQNGSIIDGPVYIDGYTWFELNYVGGTVDGWVAGEYLDLA